MYWKAHKQKLGFSERMCVCYIIKKIFSVRKTDVFCSHNLEMNGRTPSYMLEVQYLIKTAFKLKK